MLHFRYCNHMSRRTKFESLFWAEYVYRMYHLEQLDKNTVTDNFILPNHVIWYRQLIVYKALWY